MKLVRLMALVAFLPVAALAAAPMETSQLVDGSGVPLGTFANPLFVSGGGGGGGDSSGPAYVGQFNSTLPTFASGQAGYLSVDSNGRLLISPLSTIPTSDGTDGAGTNPGTGARGWLSGIYARLGGTLSVVIGAGSNTIGAVTQAGTWAISATLQAGSAIIGKVGIDQTTPGTTNGVVVNSSSLPAGAATSANQTSEIAQLTTANQRATYSADFVSFSVAANATVVGTTRSLGASPSPYSWISFNGSATVTGGTFYLQCATASDYAAGVATVATVAVTTASTAPGSATTVPVSMAERVRYPFCRTVYANGANAGTITGATSLTVN